MKKYAINIKNLSTMFIYTNIEKINKKMIDTRNISKTIPAEIQYLGDFDTVEEDVNYILLLDSKMQYIDIDKKNNTANIMTDKEKFFFPDLVYLTICMFANDLQKKQIYFVQSSVVKYDDEHSIMLIGDPNAGKTSMAYSLMKEYGFSLVSNDNVLIKSNETICGTKDMQMRYGAIKTFFPEILPYIEVLKEDQERNDWDIKIFINDYLQEKGFKTADSSIITDVYNIATFKEGNAFIKRREPVDELLLMYEQITKQIRSNRYAIIGMNYPIPSFEKEEYMQERYDIAKEMAKNINVYDAKGPIKSLTKKIGERYVK